MPSIDDLQHAGDRVARRSVPIPPSIDSLRAEVAKRRGRKRRVVGSSAAVLGLAIGIPFAAAQIGADDTVPSLLTAGQDGTDQSAQAESTVPENAPPTDVPTTTGPPTTDNDDAGDEPDVDHPKNELGSLDLSDLDFNFDFGDGFAFSLKTIGGDAAAEAAAEAEAAADETREVDNMTIWVDVDGDSTTVSSLVEPDLFMTVTGPSESIDSLLELLDGNSSIFGFSRPGEAFDPSQFEDLLPPELRERLGDFEGGFPDGLLDLEHFDFDDFDRFNFGDIDGLEDLEDLEGFSDLLTPELRERLESGDFGGLFDFGDLFDLDKRGVPHPEGEETSVSA